MVFALNYRRPALVSSSRASFSGDEKPKSIGGSTINSQGSGVVIQGIPEALSFDKIIAGGTCPVSHPHPSVLLSTEELTSAQPCTTRDFLNYLIYIEHAAENLQFFLWYNDYVKRFNNLPAKEQALAPSWSAEKEGEQQEGKEATEMQKQQISPEAAAAFKGTDFAAPKASVKEINKNPFNTPPRSSRGDADSIAASEAAWSEGGSTLNVSRVTGGSHQRQAAEAFETADLKWQPCKILSYASSMISDTTSHYSTFQRRDRPYHRNLHR